MKLLIITLFALITSCAPKVLVRNCSQTQDAKFYVCDPVWTAK